MKKQIHPGVAVAAVMAALLFILFTYYKKTESPPPMPMSPLGPGVVYLRQHPDALEKVMSPAEKQMMQRVIGVKPDSRGSAPPPPASGTGASPEKTGGK